MKIFTAEQVKKWDASTIKNEPITSIDLMERASTACYKWLIGKNLGQFPFRVFCGMGNNGGDGLVIARLLLQHKYAVTVYVLDTGNAATEDFELNRQRLSELHQEIHYIRSEEDLPQIQPNEIILDALVGMGLNKPLKGIAASLVSHINGSMAVKIAIDIPSGMSADKTSKGHTVIHAHHTLTFQNLKLAFLLPENAEQFGEVHILNIGLDPEFEKQEKAAFELAGKDLIKTIYKPRMPFAHKGTYGLAALLCGTLGMMGAAVLSARSCLRAGAGKLTVLIPQCGYDILQSSVPEAMCVIAGDEFITIAPRVDKYSAIGIGPGIGIHDSHPELLKKIFKENKTPMVVDADALNVIAGQKKLLKNIPPGSILTPHPKEFEKLFGAAGNDHERLEQCRQRAAEYNVYIILKGHFSFIATPDGKAYFNSTGNAGMATPGSGDVLTGILTALLAQGYSSLETVLFGTFIHGLAGDLAAAKYSQEAMIAGDIVDCLPDAFKSVAL